MDLEDLIGCLFLLFLLIGAAAVAIKFALIAFTWAFS
jgi:hypothetical protein